MSIFQDVKQAVSIRQAVEYQGIKVNRAGKFICPFHSDTHPSASIKKDYFNCFVCGAGGDAITFTAKYLGQSNLDAAKYLAQAFGVCVDDGQPRDSFRARLAADKRKREQAQARAKEEYIRHAGRVLAAAHRILWQGVNLYPYDDERHVRGLQGLTQCQYWLEQYDADPEGFCEQNKGVIRCYESRIDRWDQQDGRAER